LLDFPQFTRPADFRNLKVPEVLLSGHHAAIRQWRKRQAIERTLDQRPDLLALAELDDEEREMLAELKQRRGQSTPSGE
jgi:tRNA (guanine37-N1)-methyltransferase